MLFDPSFSTDILKLVAMKIGVKTFVEIRTLRFEDRKYKRQKLVYGKKKKKKNLFIELRYNVCLR